MTNPFDELSSALDQAEDVKRAVRGNSDRMARMLLDGDGLRYLHPHYLSRLKRELRNYDIHRGRWVR